MPTVTSSVERSVLSIKYETVNGSKKYLNINCIKENSTNDELYTAAQAIISLLTLTVDSIIVNNRNVITSD